MGILPGLGSAGSGRGIATATYCGAKTSSSTVTTITHTAAPIGTPSDGRYILLVMGHRNVGGATDTVSQVTVNGVSCTGVYGITRGNAADDPQVEFWITDTPIASGTTADIAVTYFGPNDRHCVGIYSLVGIHRTHVNSEFGASDNGTGLITVPLAKREGGCTIAAAYFISGSGSQTVTFGGDEIVEDAQVQIASTTGNMAFASASGNSGATIDITATSSVRNNADTMVAVSFTPG